MALSQEVLQSERVAAEKATTWLMAASLGLAALAGRTFSGIDLTIALVFAVLILIGSFIMMGYAVACRNFLKITHSDKQTKRLASILSPK